MLLIYAWNLSFAELNRLLIQQDKANKTTSYITEPWFDMYLRDRQPIVLNYNPCIAYVDDLRPGYNEQSIRAANFLISAIRFDRAIYEVTDRMFCKTSCVLLRFRETLRSGMLEPEVYHMNPSKSDTDTFRNVVRLLPSGVSWYGAYLFKVCKCLSM